MIEGGYDLAIRVNPAPDEALVGRPFLHDRIVIVASPDLPRRPDASYPAVVRGTDALRSWSVAGPEGLAAITIKPCCGYPRC